MENGEIRQQLGEIIGTQKAMLQRLDGADRARHDMRQALQALGLQMQPLIALTRLVTDLEVRVAELERREARRFWFGLGALTTGGAGGGFGVSKLIEWWQGMGHGP